MKKAVPTGQTHSQDIDVEHHVAGAQPVSYLDLYETAHVNLDILLAHLWQYYVGVFMYLKQVPVVQHERKTHRE